MMFSKNSIQQSWYIAQISSFNSYLTKKLDEGTYYLKLKDINNDLVKQNKQLLQQVYGKQTGEIPKFRKVHDTLGGGQIYTFVDGDVIYNSINRKNNYFTINRGKNDGVFGNMGIISPSGIAGIVLNSTDSYAIVKSILSQNNINIIAALKNSEYFGNLTWNGENTRLMNLSDIPKYVSVKIGDTIVTDKKSSVFPQGIMIGTVAGKEVDTKTGFLNISVELSQKIGKLNKIFVIKNMKKAEIDIIQDSLKTTILKNDK